MSDEVWSITDFLLSADLNGSQTTSPLKNSVYWADVYALFGDISLLAVQYSNPVGKDWEKSF